MMTTFFNILPTQMGQAWAFLGDARFVLFAVIIALSLKVCLLVLLALRGLRSSKLSTPLLLLLIILIGGIAEDIPWILDLINKIFSIHLDSKVIIFLDSRIILFFINIGWGFTVVKWQAFALFIENLSQRNARPKLYQLPFLVITGAFFLLFFLQAFYYIDCFASWMKPVLQINTLKMVYIYVAPLIIWSILSTLWKLRSTEVPKIIKKQLKIFIRYLVLPTIAVELIQVYLVPSKAHEQSVAGISTIVLTCAIYYGARKVMGLRFLNLYEHIRSPKDFDFMKDFKNVLEQFSHVTNERELTHITKNFFKNAFHIPVHEARLYIRNSNNAPSLSQSVYQPISETAFVENFIGAHDGPCKINSFLREKKIIITDELSFNNFYQKNETYSKLLTFLATINADIFLPVYDKEKLVAYIIIERYARARNMNKNAEFYSNIERDQMVVFAAYLGNIIHLLHNRNLNTLIAQEKNLREELYSKHQKINQYKESIRSFLRTNQEKKIGIIFYKNRRFTFGNKTAHDLIQVNINTHDGHPITKEFKKIAQQALEYKSNQSSIVQNNKGDKLVLSAIPNSEQNNVIITVYYPEISDVLKKKMELLSDPTKWDYLLYLETTKSGKLIDQLIPSTGEKLLNFKIDLLKMALSKKALLLDMPKEDLLPTVELLHHISLRENLHVLDLQGPSNNIETATKLFGINPIFGLDTTQEKPLLEKLDNNGTLFIKNIHFLNLETQEYLAEYLQYGVYRTFKSDQKRASNVRIICSTNHNIQESVSEGLFSKTLFNELNKTSLVMPSLITLSEDELATLATGFTKQMTKIDAFNNLLALTNSEKKRLARAKPASLQELKTKVQQILIKKSQKNKIYEEVQFDPAYSISDPELVEAARLGKHALKDQKMMALLWNKFKNQNKIATLLGVNRSSVNRRCKEYGLL